MSYALSTQGQGGAVYLTMPACSINAGTNPDVSGIEFDIQPLTGNSAGFFNIAGVSGNNTTSFRIEVATGVLQWRYSGTVYLSSAAGVAPMNERARYGAEWDESNSSLYLTKNGERIAGPYVASSALHTNIAWSQIGRVGTSSPSPQAFELYGVRTYGGNATYQAQWDETGASGTGGNWADDSATRNITITSATGAVDSWWIYYGGVSEYIVNITGTYAGYTASVVADATEPVFTVSVAASYASYIAAVNSTNTKPIKSASIVSTYPSYTASISATGGNVTYNSSINTTYPKYTASVAVVDVNKLSISTSYPAYTSNVISTNTKPIKTASVVGTYAQYSASVVATKVSVNKTVSINATYPVYSVSSVLTNVDPTRSVSVNVTYPNYGAACTLTNVDPVNVVSINSTYPKYSASINAGTLIQDRTLSINSSYPTYVAAVVLGDFVSLPYIGGKGAHLVISLGSRDVIIKDKSRNVKWRVENARL